MRAGCGEAVGEVSELAEGAIDLYPVRAGGRFNVDGAGVHVSLEQVEAERAPAVDVEIFVAEVPDFLIHVEGVVRGGHGHPVPRLRQISADVVFDSAIGGAVGLGWSPVKLLFPDDLGRDFLARLVGDRGSACGVGRNG